MFIAMALAAKGVENNILFPEPAEVGLLIKTGSVMVGQAGKIHEIKIERFCTSVQRGRSYLVPIIRFMPLICKKITQTWLPIIIAGMVLHQTYRKEIKVLGRDCRYVTAPC